MRLMKKFFTTLAAVAMLAAVWGCNKEHQCKCVWTDESDDNEQLKVFVIDGGLDCDDITEMAFEEKYVTDDGISLHHVDVHKVKCRPYGD